MTQIIAVRCCSFTRLYYFISALDFDYKKRQGASDEEVRDAEEKFLESLRYARLGMNDLIVGRNVEHISQLAQFADSLLDYHKKCVEVLQRTTDTLKKQKNEALGKPTPQSKPIENLPTQDSFDWGSTF